MTELPGRRATLVVHPTRERLGPFRLDEPWWPETETLIAAAFSATGRRFVVLRILDVTTDRHGGDPTYLVEEESMAGAEGAADNPNRMPWARPGEALGDVAWATSALDGPVHATQVKSWNLSSIWRFSTPGEPKPLGWLKVVPPFFAHEGPLAAWLDGRGHPVPHVVALDGARTLYRHVDGVDGHGALRARQLILMDELVEIGVSCAPAVDELLALGVPDRRDDSLAQMTDATIASRADELTVDERVQLDRLATEIGHRLDIARDAGIADTLVHGDPHPGNARFIGESTLVAILDWGDATIGCPLLDLPRMPDVRAEWLNRWADAVPGSDPVRAWEAVEPLALLRNAIVYQRFLDCIEPSEWVYHRFDVLPHLARAAALMGGAVGREERGTGTVGPMEEAG